MVQMDCYEVQEAIELFVLGALPAPEQARVEAHLAACVACRAAEEECRLLVSEIQLAADTAAPRPGFEREVSAAVAAAVGAQRRRARARRALAVAGSAAALVLIGLGLWLLWHSEGGGRPAAATLPEIWRYGSTQASPASVADGVVVQGRRVYLLRREEGASRVVAVDAVTGRPLWASPSQSSGYIAADRSHVYCLAGGPRSLDMVALSADDGRALWTYSHAGRPSLHGPCRPVPLPGGRVCWTAHRAVHMLDAATGKLVWSHSIPDEGPLSSAVSEGERLYVVTGRGLHCLDVRSGEKSWGEEFGTAAPGQGRPLLAVAGGTACFVLPRRGLGSQLFCMDLAARGLLWTRAAPEARSLLASADEVYVRGQRIQALDGRTGKLLWARAAAGCSPLTQVDGLLHFVDTSEEGRLVALDPRTGTEAWGIAGIRSCDAFTRVGGTGYIKTQDGIVHALALRSGGSS